MTKFETATLPLASMPPYDLASMQLRFDGSMVQYGKHLSLLKL